MSEREKPVSKRVSNRRRVRREVASAAVGLFDRQGFDETTVDEVAEAAGVSRRTLFRHFQSKADLVFADHEEQLERMEELLAPDDRARPPLEVLPELAASVIRSLTDPAEFYLARNRVLRASPELRRREQAYGLQYARPVTRFLLDRLPPTPDRGFLAEIIAISLVTVVNHAQRQWAAAGGDLDAVALTRSGTDLMVRVFGPFVAQGEDQTGGDEEPTISRAEVTRLVHEILAG